MDDKSPVERALLDLLDAIAAEKPNDRSEKDRTMAILKTDAEKLLAWYKLYCSSPCPCSTQHQTESA